MSSEIETDNSSTLTLSHDFNQMKVVSVTVSHCAVVGAEVRQDGVGDDQGGYGAVLPPLGDHLVGGVQVYSTKNRFRHLIVAGPGVDGVIFVFPHDALGWRH